MPPNYKKKDAPRKVARKAKTRKGKHAQSKQIISLAKSISYIKDELRDHSVPLTWENNLQQTALCRNAFLGNPNASPYNKSSNVVVIPLTSVGDPELGAIPNTQVGASFPSLVGGAAHTPVQPFGRDIGDTNQPHVGASWMKLYNQHVHMCFRQNDLKLPVRYKLFVVRLAKPEDGSSLDSQLLAVRRNIDGIALTGAPTANDNFQQGADYYSSDGWNPPSSGTSGQIDIIGSALPSMNSNRYVVEHQRSFVLGPKPRVISSTSNVIRPYVPAVESTPEARDYYECKFKINYGGVKVMAPNDNTASANKEASQTIMDIQYKNIRSDILRWVVLFADTSQIEGGTDFGNPVYTLRSTIKSRVPA